MRCSEVTERLPWLLNGSLGPGERRQIETHLGACGGCRDERAATRLAAAVYGAHPVSRSLVDLAWDRPGEDGGLALRHLESCPECTADLTLARAGRGLEAAVEAPRAPEKRWRAPRWAVAAGLAAAFAAGVGAGGLGGTHRIAQAETERALLAGRVALAEDGAARLRAVEMELRQKVRRLSDPHLNVPVVEVLPGMDVRRSTAASAALAVPSDAPFVTLLLVVDEAPRAPVSVEIQDAGGRRLWTGDGLRPGPLGAYSLAVPRHLLPDGRLTLRLRTRDRYAPVETFRLDVRRTP